MTIRIVSKPMKNIALAFITVALMIPAAAASQGLITEVSKKGTTAAPFLSIGQGARATALGSAFVAIADDQSSMYWNPAGVAHLTGIGVIVDHTEWVADIQYEYLGVTIDLGSFGGLGLNFTGSNIGDMKVTTVDQQDGTGEIFGVSDLAFGVTYGLRLTDAFSIGFNPKFVYQKIWRMSASAVAVDIGIKYRTPFKGVTLGMAISNFGSKMQMLGNSSLVLYDPDPDGTGNNGRIPANLSTEEWSLPLNFRVGLAYDVPMAEAGKLTLAVDASHPSDNYESVNVGGEYVFNEFIAIRGGYKSLFLKDSEESFALGFGVKQYVIGNLLLKLDYAYQDFNRLKNVQKVTLGVEF